MLSACVRLCPLMSAYDRVLTLRRVILTISSLVAWSGESSCRDSASEWNDKTKHAVFVFHSRAPPIL